MAAEKSRDLFVFCNGKAGMDKVDRDRVDQIVLEASKHSKFFKKSCDRDEQAGIRLEAMKSTLSEMTRQERQQRLDQADSILKHLETTRDLSQIHIVCDMDMFYAAVEMRDNPKLQRVPLAVGNNSMICTTNYIARQYGVRAAMPGFIGKKLCPALVFVDPNMAKYAAVAKDIRHIFTQYDPDFSPVSLDEAYLKVKDI